MRSNKGRQVRLQLNPTVTSSIFIFYHIRACNYGTVLYIESVQYTADGRSVIKTRGERRFEVQSFSMNDGLHMAKIEFIADKLVENRTLQLEFLLV